MTDGGLQGERLSQLDDQLFVTCVGLGVSEPLLADGAHRFPLGRVNVPA